MSAVAKQRRHRCGGCDELTWLPRCERCSWPACRRCGSDSNVLYGPDSLCRSCYLGAARLVSLPQTNPTTEGDQP